MNIKNIQENLKKGQSLTLYSAEELKYLESPIGKIIYNTSVEENEKPIPNNTNIPKECIGTVYKNWYDKVTCNVCGAVTVRSNQSQHKHTKKHKVYADMNEKIRKLLLNNI